MQFRLQIKIALEGQKCEHSFRVRSATLFEGLL